MLVHGLIPTLGFLLIAQMGSGILALKWQDGQNGFPQNALAHDSFPPDVLFYCRGLDSKGQLRTGTVHKGQRHCGLTSMRNDAVENIRKYEVLIREPEDVIDYQFHFVDQPAPANAVPCIDNESKECFLGESVFTDGLCRELPGKIFLDQERVLMNHSGRKVICSVFSIMVRT